MATRRDRAVPAHERIAAWPTQPLPMPFQHLVSPNAELRDGLLLFGDDVQKRLPHPELFVGLWNLNLDSGGEVLEFFQRGGRLQGGATEHPEQRPRNQGRVRRGFFPVEEDPKGAFSVAVGKEGQALDRRRHTLKQRFTSRHPDSDEVWTRVYNSELIDEFLYSATCFRDLYRAFLWVSEGVVPLKWESRVWKRKPTEHGPTPPATQVEAAAFLGYQLTATLQPFSPLAVLLGADSDDVQDRLDDYALPLVDRADGEISAINDDEVREAHRRFGISKTDYWIGGYAICCLQLFNHLVSGAPTRSCAAPDCSKHFLKGEAANGGVRKRQPNEGSDAFCSTRCRKRIAKRNERNTRPQ